MAQPTFDPQLYYDTLTALYIDLFGHDWHLGYWLNALDAPEAAERLNGVIAGHLPSGEQTTVLDVGCGAGGPACSIAQHNGCRVVGVSNSRAGIAEAERLAKKRGLTDRVIFQFGEMLNLPFADASFDALFACESIHNVADRQALAGELARVLKPDGTAVIGDLFLRRAPEAGGADLDRLRGFSFHLATADSIIATLEQNGLMVHTSFDIGHHMGPAGTFRYRDTCLERARSLKEPSLEKTILERTAEATETLAEGFRCGDLGWGVWVARKS